MPLTRPLADRFWEKVNKRGPDECWLWTANIARGGYGTIGLGGRLGKVSTAHRVSYQLNIGPIPIGVGHHGTCVLHRCDTPACVNPAHLFLGTQLDNIADRQRKNRGVAVCGEAHGGSKLTAAQVIEIRKSGEPHTHTAIKYGVSDTLISYIRKHKSWKHVTEVASDIGR